MRTPITLAALAILAAGIAAGCATKKGYQKSEYLADEVHACVASIDAYGTCREASVESMNALITEPFDGRPAKFEAFHKSVDRVVAGDGSLRESITAMKASAAGRFQAWSTETASFSDQDMQAHSRKGHAEAAATFQVAAADADAMLAQSASFVSYLSELRKVLSNDLTEKGLAGAADFAEKARLSNRQLDGMTHPTRASLGAAAVAMSSRDATR